MYNILEELCKRKTAENCIIQRGRIILLAYACKFSAEQVVELVSMALGDKKKRTGIHVESSRWLKHTFDLFQFHAKQLLCQRVQEFFGALDMESSLNVVHRFAGLKGSRR